MRIEEEVIIDGQKLTGPFSLYGWRDMYVNPAPNAEGKVDLYFTVSPDYLHRLQELKTSLDKDNITTSFIPQNSSEFGAFSNIRDISRVLEEGGGRIQFDMAEHSLRNFVDASLVQQLISQERPDLMGKAREITGRAHQNLKSTNSFLGDQDTPVADRALLKASVPSEQLQTILTEHFGDSTAKEVAKHLDSSGTSPAGQRLAGKIATVALPQNAA